MAKIFRVGCDSECGQSDGYFIVEDARKDGRSFMHGVHYNRRDESGKPRLALGSVRQGEDGSTQITYKSLVNIKDALPLRFDFNYNANNPEQKLNGGYRVVCFDYVGVRKEAEATFSPVTDEIEIAAAQALIEEGIQENVDLPRIMEIERRKYVNEKIDGTKRYKFNLFNMQSLRGLVKDNMEI